MLPTGSPLLGIASLDFVAKKGVHQYFEYDDPMLYKLFGHYLQEEQELHIHLSAGRVGREGECRQDDNS